MRFVVSGGGTGGHIYPALALAQGLKETFPGAEILYIGAKDGMEAEIVPRENLPFAGITVAGLQRRLTLTNLLVLGRACRGFTEAWGYLRQWRPQVALGTGGYVCGPVILAAAAQRIPTLIHEQNAYPGLTNRLLSRVADGVAATFADSVKHFPARAKITLTGLPVRPEILTADRTAARARLGLAPDQPLLLSFGGSRGAQSLNAAILPVLKEFGGSSRLSLFHITGQAGYPAFLDQAKASGVDLDALENITVEPYRYDMSALLAAADLVLSRAGATTLAEITALGLPSLLVPYPHAAENHQEYNARALEKEGAALVILDRELSGAVLCSQIRELIADPERTRQMGQASKKLGKTKALQEIIAWIEKQL